MTTTTIREKDRLKDIVTVTQETEMEYESNKTPRFTFPQPREMKEKK